MERQFHLQESTGKTALMAKESTLPQDSPRPALWILNHYAVSPDMPGGARHYELAKRLVQKGYSVTIVASSFHHMLHQEMRLESKETIKVEEYDGVKFAWLKTRPYQRNDWHRMLNILDYTRRSYLLGRRLPERWKVIQRPDVIIGSSVHPFAVLSAYLLARRFHVPFITEIRDLWPQTLVDFGHYKSRHPIVIALRRLESFLYKRSALVITLLPAASAYIRAAGVPSEKIVWIPNGVDTDYYAVEAASKKPRETFDVRYVGSHGQANNLGVMLDAADLLRQRGYKGIRFTFIGDGPERSNLIAKKEALHLDNIVFEGAVPRHRVPEMLAEADVLAITPPDSSVYQYGISPNKLYEYMAAGKPIILGCNPPHNPVDLAGCGTTVSAGSPQALADGIIDLYRMNPSQRDALGARGREYVRKHHDWTVLTEQLHQCIQEVISSEAHKTAGSS